MSGCNEYDRCPRRYRYGYLDRAPHDRPTPAAWRHGIAVHAALEAAYRDRMLGRPLADTVPDALTALGEAWTAEGLPEDPAWIRRTEAMVRRTLTDDPIDATTVIGVEERFAAD